MLAAREEEQRGERCGLGGTPWAVLQTPDPRGVRGDLCSLESAMECPLPADVSEGDPQPTPSCQKQVRRQRIMVYRPAPEKQGSSAVCRKPLERGRMPSLECGDADRSPSKKQRLQQGPLPVLESSREGCGRGGETLWHMASPMERKQRKVLAVDLGDFPTTEVPEAPQRCSPLQRSPESPCVSLLPPSSMNEVGPSWPAKGQSGTFSRPSSPKGYSLSCQEPRERLGHACQKPWPQRVPQSPELERLEAKRQRLQRAAPLANGSEAIQASALEKARQQILAISLDDCSFSQARDDGAGKEPLETSLCPCSSYQATPPHQMPIVNVEEPTLPDRHEKRHQTDAPSEITEPLSSWPPSMTALLRPSVVPRFRHWGLAPVFQSMRSKLEAFADIFLSPSKPSLPSSEEMPSLPLCPQQTEDRAAAQPGTPRRGVNIQVKIAISEPRPRKRTCHPEEEEAAAGSLVVSGRPPICQWRLNEGDPAPQPRLGRSYSCPDFPGARSWRASATSLSLPAQLRQRRHTVCSLEVSRELGRPTMPCLRKEVYPFSTPPGSTVRPSAHSPRCDGSSHSSPVPSCCFASDPVHSRDLSSSPDGAQRVPGVGRNVADSEMLTSEQVMLSESEGSQENTVGKVSCIRIRRTPVRQQANLTPMGLPRPVRLNKKEFSLEEIYTNKNYRTPTEKRSFETIFEVPLERNGALVFTSQRKLKRAMEFREGGLPRKPRKARSRGGRRAGGRRAQSQPPELEEMLQQRLAELDALFEEEEC
ncbi:proline-rich protein 14 isoform X1 [Sphaerodactylus townsendi]|uniref:proline-rich protein 14 isoform X1 n=2 Tax=Sphaerodactylus townsendi TaxID=933632 RepID=UPI0020274B94|nr:proline-rich protein 14 isoform X1 [Sphaerodactylus townsendi]